MDVQPIPEPSNRGYYIVICIIIGLVYYFVSPYFSIIVDFIEFARNTIDLLITFSSSLSKNIVDETSIGSKTVVNKLSRKPKPRVKTPAPDESSSTIQGGYCYVGEWKGVRSCVKVDKKTPCETQVYSTEELCVNPTLRP
jgi:hypothetical protein|uniref:Uncharacterized protein n=1 Tax=viral metagenome TaxID=1070528 RepID=A0A6C0B8S8_9ZZZZ